MIEDSTEPAVAAAPPGRPRLLDQTREAIRSRHYSRRTEQAYCLWIERFIRFNKMRHPADMAEDEINAFLTHLAADEHIRVSIRMQALSALLFLYRYALGRKAVTRSRPPLPLRTSNSLRSGSRWSLNRSALSLRRRRRPPAGACRRRRSSSHS